MEFIQHGNLTRFLAFFPSIKKSIPDWRLINIRFATGTDGSIFYVAKKVWNALRQSEGQIFMSSSRELLVLIKTGKGADTAALAKSIQSECFEYQCIVDIIETTKDGLQKVEMRLRQANDPGVPGEGHGQSLLLNERRQRQTNVILVADDDMFMRSLVKKAMEPHGEVTVLADGAGVVDTYLKILPDIVFLDIHLPVRSGIEILDEIWMFDQDAHVIMLSSDSAKDNVLITKKIGAKGFIAKPFTKEKLEEALWKCPTIVRKR